jgi:hypothetical protein
MILRSVHACVQSPALSGNDIPVTVARKVLVVDTGAVASVGDTFDFGANIF